MISMTPAITISLVIPITKGRAINFRLDCQTGRMPSLKIRLNPKKNRNIRE